MSAQIGSNFNSRILKVLLRPHVSEKSATIADKFRQYTFEVMKDANKLEIQKAVEQLFNVQVEQVRVLNTKGKQKKFKQMQGRRKDWKKAYVKLKDGHKIDFMGIGQE